MYLLAAVYRQAGCSPHCKTPESSLRPLRLRGLCVKSNPLIRATTHYFAASASASCNSIASSSLSGCETFNGQVSA